MAEWSLRVDTFLMGQDLMDLGGRMSHIYHNMERLEVIIAQTENFWAGEVRDVWTEKAKTEWSRLAEGWKGVAEWCGKLEQIRTKYQTCKETVQNEMTASRI